MTERPGSGRYPTKVGPDGMAMCTVCGESKHYTLFNTRTYKTKHRGLSTVLMSQCKACDKIRHKKWATSPKGKKVQKRHNDEKYNRIKRDPKRLEEHRRKTREWQRENGAEYKFYREKIKPLLK